MGGIKRFQNFPKSFSTKEEKITGLEFERAHFEAAVQHIATTPPIYMCACVCVIGFYGISTIVGYLMPHPFHKYSKYI